MKPENPENQEFLKIFGRPRGGPLVVLIGV